MDAQQFLAEFGHIASAPGGVKCLREVILSLAVRGELIEQRSRAVNNGAELLVAAAQHIANSESNKKGLSRTRSLARTESVPYALRKSWVWSSLGAIASYITDGSHNPPKNAGSGYPMLSSQNVINGAVDFSNVSRFLNQEDFDLEDRRTQIESNDVLLTIVGTIGRAAVVQASSPKFALQRSVAVIRTPLNPQYLVYVLHGPFSQTYFQENAKGTAQKGIYLGKLAELPIPFPCLEEQNEIVAKVDELMALCDKLEAQQQECSELRKKCCTEIIKSLALSSNTHELRKAWNSTQIFLSYPFIKKEEITSLRTAIMKLATRGILTSQHPHERGLDFINELAELRTKKSTNRSRRFNEDPVEEREIPHLIPENWVWARLGAVAEISSGSTPLKSRDDYHLSGTIPWITSTLTGRLYIDSADFFITEKAVKECNLSIYPAGTLIMAMYGQGKTRGQVTELRITATTNQACAAIVLLDKSETFRRYVRIVLEERYHDIREFADGGPQPNLNGIKVKATVIPMPPKEEQERIVAMVTALTSLCDDLESKLHKSTKLAKNLATAAISSITGIRIEEEEALKTPKTELISKLRLVNNPDIKEQAPLAAILARHHDEMPASDLWQRYGGDIDAFYAQLKLEVGKGWIEEPAIAEMRETEAG